MRGQWGQRELEPSGSDGSQPWAQQAVVRAISAAGLGNDESQEDGSLGTGKGKGSGEPCEEALWWRPQAVVHRPQGTLYRRHSANGMKAPRQNIRY